MIFQEITNVIKLTILTLCTLWKNISQVFDFDEHH